MMPGRFGEGDVSNKCLRDKSSKEIEAGVALAAIQVIDGTTETFNFITRNGSSGVLGRLNAFIAADKGCYAPKS